MCKSLVPVLFLLLPGCSPGPMSGADTPDGEESAPMPLIISQHCVASATATVVDPEGRPSLRQPTRPLQCFATFSAAIAFATGGRVRLPNSATPADVDENLLNGGMLGPGGRPQASHVIAVESLDRDHGGASLTVESPVSCDFATVSLNLTGVWSDSVSSARSFGGCTHAYHYDNSSLSGARTDCGRDCPELADGLENRTSSIKWTRSP